jgi:hypothetical protein
METYAMLVVLVVVVIVMYLSYRRWGRAAPKPEVYVVDSGWNGFLAGDDLDAAAAKLGGVLASPAQVDAAYKAGADWCKYGFVNNVLNGGRQMLIVRQSDAPCPFMGYAYPKKGITAEWAPLGWKSMGAGIIVYGPKPPRGTYPESSSVGSKGLSVYPWSPTSYNAPS